MAEPAGIPRRDADLGDGFPADLYHGTDDQLRDAVTRMKGLNFRREIDENDFSSPGNPSRSCLEN